MRLFAGVVGAALVLVVAMLVSSVASASVGSSGAPSVAHANSSPTYTVAFNETGLPAGTAWAVHYAYVGCGCDGPHGTVKGTTSSLTVALPNGTYRYHVDRVSGYFVNVSASGTLSVAGTPAPSVTFAFHPVVPFLVEFTETGLPNGTLWTVSVRGNGNGQAASLEHVTESSYTTSLNFTLLNGTYRYTVDPVTGSFFNGPSHGKFVVAGGSPAPIAVSFLTPPSYTLSFVESGLPSGTNWSVRIGGGQTVHVHETHSSTTEMVNFSLPAGTYRYTLSEVLGFAVSGPASGSVDLTSSGATVNVTYRSLAPGAFYTVTFDESGLASATHWSVGVLATHTFGHSRHETQSSNTTSLQFLLQNGTYRFTVGRVRGYTVNISSGTFSVAGASPATVELEFSAIPTYSVTISEVGLANGTNWSVLVHTQASVGSVYPVRETLTANVANITFELPNGSFCYVIHAVSGYRITSGSAKGSFVIAGAAGATITIGFTAKG